MRSVATSRFWDPFQALPPEIQTLARKNYQPPQFRTPALYRLVRHPLYIGWLIIFWAAPVMTSAHLLFAFMTTAYILIAIRLEERSPAGGAR